MQSNIAYDVGTNYRGQGTKESDMIESHVYEDVGSEMKTHNNPAYESVRTQKPTTPGK